MSKCKTHLFRLRIVAAAVVFFLALAAVALGAYRYVSWTEPLNQGDYNTAASSAVGERAIALYDRGLIEWQRVATDQDESAAQAHLTAASTDLNAAYDALLEEGGGTVADRSKKLASDIQFTLGNIQVMVGLAQQDVELIQAGVQNYEECLRLDPDNLAAKYNIELLEQSNEVNKQNNPGGPGKPGDKPGEPGSQPGQGGAGHNHGDGT